MIVNNLIFLSSNIIITFFITKIYREILFNFNFHLRYSMHIFDLTFTEKINY